MIKKVTEINDTLNIWSEAFGDTAEEILFFAENVKNADCIGLYKDGVLASMMYLVKCKTDGLSAYYVYAACTLEAYRSRGLMSELLEYAKGAYKNVCLIPADEDLDAYYKKRGFTVSLPLSRLAFDQSDEIKEYLFEGYNLKEPHVLLYKGE